MLKHFIKIIFSYGFIFFMSSLWILTSVFLGGVLLKILKLKSNHKYIHTMNSFWIGNLIFVSLLMFINLFFPINLITSTIILILIYLSSFIINKKEILQIIKKILNIKFLIFYTLFNFLVMFSLISIFPANIISWDGYIYHLKSVNLINYYPAIKGIISISYHIGNFCSGFYSASFFNSFMFFKFLRYYMFFISSQILTLGLYFSIYAVIKSVNLSSLIKSNKFKNKLFLAFILSIFIVSLNFVLINVHFRTIKGADGFHNLDFNVALMSIISLLLFFLYVKDINKLSLIVLISVSISNLLIKLSSIVFVLMIAFITTAIWFYQKKNIKTYFKCIFLGIIIFLPFIFQNIIKSGTLLYPVAFTDLNLPWNNNTLVKDNQYNVTTWARGRGDYMNLMTNHKSSMIYDLSWIKPWLSKKYGHARFLLEICSYYLLLLSFYILVLKNQIKKSLIVLFISISAFITMFVYWFFMMPSMRFSGILFSFPNIILLGLIFIQIIEYIKSKLTLKELEKTKFTLKKILSKELIIFSLFFIFLVPTIKAHKILKYKKLETFELDSKVSTEGVRIYFPKAKGTWWCGYVNKDQMPCTTGKIELPKNYTFIDKNKWYKGIIKKEEK